MARTTTPYIDGIKIRESGTVYSLDDVDAVEEVQYANNKITRTINGVAQDVVTNAQLKEDMALNNVTNNAQVKGLASGTTNGNVVAFGTDGYTVQDSGVAMSKINFTVTDGTWTDYEA